VVEETFSGSEGSHVGSVRREPLSYLNVQRPALRGNRREVISVIYGKEDPMGSGCVLLLAEANVMIKVDRFALNVTGSCLSEGGQRNVTCV